MKNTFNCFLLLLVSLLLYGENVIAQPFAEDIAAFKKQDSVSFPPKQAILFVGSSSFTNWKDVQNYFPQFTILNRGFGGSSVSDVIRYADDIIFPYMPKQIVIYCGENDLAGSDSVTGEMVFERFVQLFTVIRNKMPKVPVAFISLKPSPSRWHFKEKMIVANKLVKKYLRKKKNAAFIDVYHKMLGADGIPIKEIFIEDNLHMNDKGYAIWQKVIEPYLKN
jgi:lysophospholipase L1-like esterase